MMEEESIEPGHRRKHSDLADIHSCIVREEIEVFEVPNSSRQLQLSLKRGYRRGLRIKPEK